QDLPLHPLIQQPAASDRLGGAERTGAEQARRPRPAPWSRPPGLASFLVEGLPPTPTLLHKGGGRSWFPPPLWRRAGWGVANAHTSDFATLLNEKALPRARGGGPGKEQCRFRRAHELGGFFATRAASAWIRACCDWFVLVPLSVEALELELELEL